MVDWFRVEGGDQLTVGVNAYGIDIDDLLVDEVAFPCCSDAAHFHLVDLVLNFDDCGTDKLDSERIGIPEFQ